LLFWQSSGVAAGFHNNPPKLSHDNALVNKMICYDLEDRQEFNKTGKIPVIFDSFEFAFKSGGHDGYAIQKVSYANSKANFVLFRSHNGENQTGEERRSLSPNDVMILVNLLNLYRFDLFDKYICSRKQDFSSKYMVTFRPSTHSLYSLRYIINGKQYGKDVEGRDVEIFYSNRQEMVKLKILEDYIASLGNCRKNGELIYWK
jgi:hypothetical protein